MDPICHTFVGAALAGTHLGDRSWGAKATLLIAVNLPDIDVVSLAWGQNASLAWRRGWTHGILALTIAPLLLGWAVHWWGRRSGRDVDLRGLVGLAYLGFLTHPVLDWLNCYGMRWLMPFDGTWFYGDTLYIVDPWLWLLLGGAAFLRFSASRRAVTTWAVTAALLSLPMLAVEAVPVSARIVWVAGLLLLAAARLRGPISHLRGRFACITGLALATIYVVALFGVRNHVQQQLIEETGKRPHEVFVGQLPARVDAFDVLLVDNHAYRPGVYHLNTGLESAQPVAIDSADTMVLAALTAPCAQGIANWLRYPFFVLEETAEGGTRVRLLDARYVRKPEVGFGAWAVTFDAEGQVVDCR